MSIAIIGAGASGLMAALQAAWGGGQVTLLERNAAPGRKLLVTGSGRCNITNQAVVAERYTCADPAWMRTLLEGFGVERLVEVLASIGIPLYSTSDGWMYPLSNSAHSVAAAFSSALRQAGVQVVTQAVVNNLRVDAQGFVVGYAQNSEQRSETFERVIVAAGGSAYPSLGARGELFPVLQRLGHSVLPQRPALAPLLAELGSLRGLQGMRLDAGVTLRGGAGVLGTARGNLIFTEWGLNGPAVMDISHLVSGRGAGGLELSLDLLAFFNAQFDALLREQRGGGMPLGVFLGAFFAPKVASVLLKAAGFEETMPLKKLTEGALQRLAGWLRDVRLEVRGVRGFEYCQVSAGGVPVGEVEASTLGSQRVKGLYLVGETLDVVGPCGGFNLHYAFASGALAGKAAAGG